MIPWWFIYNPHIGKPQESKLRGRDVLGLSFITGIALFIIFLIYYSVIYGRV